MKGPSVSRGFTIVESVVWVALFTAVMLAIMTSLISFYRTNRYVIDQASAVTSAQRGMDLMVRAIREISYGADGAYPIVAFGPNDFTFYTDYDSDPYVERVRYYLSGQRVMSSTTVPTGNPMTYSGAGDVSVVSDYVRNAELGLPLFTYYDKNGAQINDYSRVAEVRFVVINEIADVNQTSLPNQIVLRSSAALRNLVGK